MIMVLRFKTGELTSQEGDQQAASVLDQAKQERDRAEAQVTEGSPEFVKQGSRSDLQPQCNTSKLNTGNKEGILRRLAREGNTDARV